ncbi:MAG: hypothetical protein JRN67_03970 [Nitrososphaerota archaeon]|nr:hypothetical protein [Nitrososphaerota archaeon]
MFASFQELDEIQNGTIATSITSSSVNTPSLATITSTSYLSNSSCSGIASTYTHPNPNGGGWYIQVNYSGSWTATITSYNAWSQSAQYVAYTECAAGHGNFTTLAPDYNLNGESMECVTAQKTDGGTGNLTVGVTWGEALRTNSTGLLDGSTSICEGIAP